MSNTILIVEGKNDYSKIKQIYPDITILTTNGSAITNEFLESIKNLSKQNEIVLFLDPDYAGERIRKIITKAVPNAKHIFIERNEAISYNKKKIGVEHVAIKTLKEKLSDIKVTKHTKNIDLDFIYSVGLNGKANSNKKRLCLCNKLNIGYANAKQLMNKLNMFGYTQSDVMKAMEEFYD